jgi:hypothetical protein
MAIQLTVQDRIDGGISLLLRCPGSASNKKLRPEDITVDVYFTPRELAEGGDQLKSDLSIMVQGFGQDFVLPHLLRYEQRCRVEKVKPRGPAGDVIFSQLNLSRLICVFLLVCSRWHPHARYRFLPFSHSQP